MDYVQDSMRTQVLSNSPSLWPLLAQGAFLSLFKRARTGVTAPRTRLVFPGVRIDLGKLAAYERACGFEVGADELPITYPHVLGFPLVMRLLSEPAFPLPLPGLVHTSIGITRRRTMTATGEYELAVHVEKLTPHRRGTEAVVVTEVRAGGELVWESRSAYPAPHRTVAGVGGRERGTSDEREPLPVVAEWALAGDVGRRYGAASGDRNPIHLHPLTARLSGFPRAIRTPAVRTRASAVRASAVRTPAVRTPAPGSASPRPPCRPPGCGWRPGWT